MRKYAEIAKLLFKAQLAWRADIAVNMLMTVIRILFATIVWGAIFGQRDVVGGFTLQSMLTYYVVSSFLSQLDISDGVSGEISARIRDGTFSKYMVIPTRPLGHFMAQNFGAAGMYLIFNLIAAFLWVIVFRIEFTMAGDPWQLAGAALMVAMGLVFMVQLNFCVGIMAFKYQDVGIFRMIQGNLVSLITGTLVPLALLPEGIVSAMRLFPFYYVTYLPSMLIIGRGAEELGAGLLILAAWMGVLAALCPLLYGRLRGKYDGVGI